VPEQHDFKRDWFLAAISAERRALERFEKHPPAHIDEAIDILSSRTGLVVCIGVGKSGLVAAKIAATFSSLGIPALFLNAAEAAHGDLGAVQSGNCVVLFSNSGSTDEILRIVPALKDRRCKLIGVIGNLDSPLGRAVDCAIAAHVEEEADHIGMAPTASTTLQMAIGDGLAVATSRAQGFTRKDFLKHHPAGLLGRHMIPIRSLMKTGAELPRVSPSSSVAEVLAVMSCSRLGATCVVDPNEKLLGLIVDGDIRRHFQRLGDVYGTPAQVLMRRDPKVLNVDATLGDMLLFLKATDRSLLVLPVVDDEGRLHGLLRPYDVLNG
jgi:arabinose-5-phosphate isomerase